MVTINAENRILGRIASEIAIILIGKHKPNFVPYKITGDKVEVINASKIRVSGSKWEDKPYYKSSRYPGNLKIKKMKDFSKEELLKRAIWYMLPKNRLRTERFKLLKVTN